MKSPSTIISLVYLIARSLAPFQRYAIAVSGADCIDKQSVQFILANTLGLPVKERIFIPLSKKHRKSDNTIIVSDLFFQGSASDHSFLYTEKSGAHTNVHSQPYPSSSQMNQRHIYLASGSSIVPIPARSNANVPRTKSSTKSVICTPPEEELFSMLTSNINNLPFR
jgi:hypothetical protein